VAQWPCASPLTSTRNPCIPWQVPAACWFNLGLEVNLWKLCTVLICQQLREKTELSSLTYPFPCCHICKVAVIFSIYLLLQTTVRQLQGEYATVQSAFLLWAEQLKCDCHHQPGKYKSSTRDFSSPVSLSYR